MESEIRNKLKMVEVKIESTEVGSVERDMWLDIKRELQAELTTLMQASVKLHKDEGAICESCQ